MLPFFTFYGGKWRTAPKYPAPAYDTIIEPFAGAAGYSVRHHRKNVVLIEKDPVIASLWRFLIKAESGDIENLPLIEDGQTVSDLNVCEDSKSLIGFWCNKGTSRPSKSPSAWMRSGVRPKSYWGREIRSRIARQVEEISHWTVIEGEYSGAPDIEATWFIDPPYQNAGKHYKIGSDLLDFRNLGDWCRSRRGQVMVCENTGADWLPFQYFADIKSLEGKYGKAKSKESLWTNDHWSFLV